jgi:polyphosphate kinase
MSAVEPEQLFNRELSWLEFSARLLELAEDERLALFERIKFLALFAEGLDEFFQIRVAGLADMVAGGVRTRSADGLEPKAAIGAITTRTAELVAKAGRIFDERVRVELAEAGIGLVAWADLTKQDRRELRELFHNELFAVLTPLSVDPAHPFPYISNLALNLIVTVTSPGSSGSRLARVKIPPFLPRFVALGDGQRFIPVEEVVGAQLGELFPGMEVGEYQVARVTRNADLSLRDDASDLLAEVESELTRQRFGMPVRLEVSAGATDELVAVLCEGVGVGPGAVYRVHGPIDMAGLRSLCEMWREGLSAPSWPERVNEQLGRRSSVFGAIRAGDVLLHHPYESFAASVERFLDEAAADRDVLAIKHTLYRAGDDSPIVESLIRAAGAGKQVTAVVELQARFEEKANIAWARALEEAGVQVVYGLGRYKTHSKISLVVRGEGGTPRRYCHIGTGNYNSQTAHSYEDIGLLTCDPVVGADVGALFNVLTGAGSRESYDRLLVSPLSLRAGLIARIAGQGRLGAKGLIRIKTNGLTDPAVIDELYRASQAGCKIELVVRGTCCLRPGVAGLSEEIAVKSLVGRYLEHSRIFLFGRGGKRGREALIGSPDLMERSMERRVEVAVCVSGEAEIAKLVEIFEAVWADEANSWLLDGEGMWTRVNPSGERGFDAQARFAGSWSNVPGSI